VPKRFKFRLKDADDAEFNRTIVVDITFLDYNGGKLPTLHIIDEATGYNAARFISDYSTKTVWQTMKAAWMDTYIGPPEEILHDAGTNFINRKF
jgi:transposase InsO family protein